MGAERIFERLADQPSLTDGVINQDSFHKGLQNMGVSC